MAGLVSLDELAKQRLNAWTEGHGVTQTRLGKAAGHDQSWAQKYLKGERTASLDELAAMAAVFDQPVTALFDQQPDAREQRLLAAFRTLPRASQDRMLDHVEHWALIARANAPTRKRNPAP